MIKIAHLTSAHPPTDVRILEKECRSLARAGYEVCIVAPYGGDERRDGIRIRAVPLTKGRFGRFTRVIWNIYRTAVKEDAAIYHFHDPDLMPVGWLLKLHGKRVIYDVHENYRNTILSKEWIPSPVRRIAAAGAGFAELISGAAFDGVIAATPNIARLFPARKTSTVANFPVLDLFNMKNEDEEGQRRRGRVAYVGAISVERGIETMIDAIGEIREDFNPQLVLGGNFPESLYSALAIKAGWARTHLVGHLRREEVNELLHSAQVALCVLHPTPNHIDSYPIKLFEYMACGVPVVASDFPLWREFLTNPKCGLLVDPCSPRAIAEAIGWLLEHPAEAREMGRNGQRAVREKYNWDSEVRKLARMYSALAPADSKADALEVDM